MKKHWSWQVNCWDWPLGVVIVMPPFILHPFPPSLLRVQNSNTNKPTTLKSHRGRNIFLMSYYGFYRNEISMCLIFAWIYHESPLLFSFRLQCRVNLFISLMCEFVSCLLLMEHLGLWEITKHTQSIWHKSCFYPSKKFMLILFPTRSSFVFTNSWGKCLALKLLNDFLRMLFGNTWAGSR